MMSFEPVVTWAHRRRVLVFAGAVLLVALSVVGLRRITFDADVLRLLPSSGRTVPAFRAYLEAFGTLDDLYVVFTAPDGHDVGDYAEEIDEWVNALRGVPEIQRVDSGRVDGSRDWSWIADRELLLFDGATLARALDRLKPEGMPAALAATRELLTIPSPEITALVREDPLGLHDLLRQQLGPLQSALQIGVSAEGYVTPDGTRRLVIARPTRPPYDTEFSHALFVRLDAIANERSKTSAGDEVEVRPRLQVQFAGGHRIAIEAEAVVTRESLVNGVGSLALILPLLFVVFRSPWLVLIGAMPSAVALLVVLGLVGLFGVTLSAAATGASAMLFGLGVDGVVLLYVAHGLALAEGRDAESAIRGLAAPAASMLLGMWTTAATFLGLVVVDFPSLEQLGLLIGLSMIVCGVLTLVMVPASLPSSRPARLPPSLTMPQFANAVRRHRRAILGLAAILTLVAGYFATTLRVNPTLDRLRSVTEGAVFAQQVTREFGLPADVLVVFAEGPDLQALLVENETLVERLRDATPALAVQAPSSLLPSEVKQAARRAVIQRDLPDVEVMKASLEKAGVDAGFRPHSFESFSGRLARIVDAGQMLTWEGFAEHGLRDVINRLIARRDNQWMLATYAFPKSLEELSALRQAVRSMSGTMILTGLPLVNEEMSARFLPQFLLGLGVGSAIVVVLILVTFRNWHLALLTLVPTAIGLVWAAGILGFAGFELDLFSVFAVITFVGIGVDYGVHLVHRYRERKDAVSATSELAPVILVAGAITLLGYGTLIGSSYPPLRSIGLVSAVSVVTLVCASVLVLPAMLQRNRD